jgi:FAD/FMN-containing dehydrogenase/Fe-S oxidoreductase
VGDRLLEYLMANQPETPVHDLVNALQRRITGEVRFDLTTRLLYSTDASIYQIEPLGVVFPRSVDELSAIVELAAHHRVPILARGSGSSLAGQAIGNALIIDCSRHLNHEIEINPEQMIATVQPGVIMTRLNHLASQYGLQFGPDPASAERASMGGSLASNASGAHSIEYGMFVDNLLSAEVILADGSLARFGQVSLQEARRRAEMAPSFLEAGMYAAALHIRQGLAGSIRDNWPKTWRRVSGYNLNYLLPWSPSRPRRWNLDVDPQNGENASRRRVPYPPVRDSSINLAHLMAGSEGTLGVIRRATVRLVPKPRNTILGVLSFPSLSTACDAVPDLLERRPSAIELIPWSLIQLAHSIPSYARQVTFVDQLSTSGGHPAALLVVEFAGDDPENLKQQARNLRSDVLIAETVADQNRIWGVRKAGLGILLSRPGEPKPATFIEDLTVPVEYLGRFVREMEKILDSYQAEGDFYGHASAGCLHVRPLLNIKTAKDIRKMHAIAADSVDLCLSLGGASTGEHGDGLARSEWIERAYGPEIVSAFRELKRAADPDGILNPGKILDSPPMNDNLRYGVEYHVRSWQPNLDFSKQAGFAGAVELCNGAGVCRKADGVMCPSFQATADEMHSTRGRANLLRAMLSGAFPDPDQAEEAVSQALGLCLACKGCKSECPSSVDMAKLKYEYLDHYYSDLSHRHHRRPFRDYLFSYIESIARLGHYFAPLANVLLRSETLGIMGDRLIGLSRHRKLPALSGQSLSQMIAARRLDGVILHQTSAVTLIDTSEQCLFLSDPFTEYFQPEIGLAALEVLRRMDCRVFVLPVVGAGRTLISKGFIQPARRQATRLVQAVDRLDPGGKLPIIGVEPSEIYTLRDEYLDLLPDHQRSEQIARRAFMIDEYLVRPAKDNPPRILRIATSRPTRRRKVYLHGHCYQKTQPPAADGYPNGVAATAQMLESVGYEVSVIDSGCCGMAGAFGYEADHFDVSMKIGELALFPAVRSAIQEDGQALIAASGVSCQTQIEDGTGRKPLHPIMLL